jgi:hypothetical protein
MAGSEPAEDVVGDGLGAEIIGLDRQMCLAVSRGPLAFEVRYPGQRI